MDEVDEILSRHITGYKASGDQVYFTLGGAKSAINQLRLKDLQRIRSKFPYPCKHIACAEVEEMILKLTVGEAE